MSPGAARAAVVASVAFWPLAGALAPAAAAGLCPALEAAVGAVADGTLGAAPPPVLEGASECRIATEPDGSAYYCLWQYPYRAEAARAAFAALESQLAACTGVSAGRDDFGVNHPDSYAARLYDLDQARIVVSLKDKAAERRTVIFLRVSPVSRR